MTTLFNKLSGSSSVDSISVSADQEDHVSMGPIAVRKCGEILRNVRTVLAIEMMCAAQAFEFHAGSFIHYGLGNLFFDQMQTLGTRQEFLDRHVFYEGRHVSTELLTAILEDYSRPRPMTVEEREELLAAVFAASGW